MSIESNNLLSSWAAFFVAHALSMRKIEESLDGKAPLSMHEYDVLLTIERSPEKRLRYSEVVSASLFTKSGITRILKRFESKGFIERVVCEHDQRGAFAVLTTKGEKALRDTWTPYRKAILEILGSSLSDSQAKSLENIMEKIIDYVRGASLIQIGTKSPGSRASKVH